MRLIDANALTDAIERTDWYHNSEQGNMVHGAVYGDNAWYKAEDIYKALEDAHTIEAEPVKHGRWIPDDKFPSGKSSIFHCSECYYSRTTSVLYTSEKLSQDDPYCKKCGAKMDVEGVT